MIRAYGGQLPKTQNAVFLAETASITGDVTLGRNTSVFYGAVLRGDVCRLFVGENSNVQDNAVLHASHGCPLQIGSGVTVGHSAVVHGCTVEDDVLIGMHATLLNHCVIGRGSIVAAGALVPEGMIVPPGSMVMGVPARVRGPLTEKQASMIPASAAEYLDLAKGHRAEQKLEENRHE